MLATSVRASGDRINRVHAQFVETRRDLRVEANPARQAPNEIHLELITRDTDEAVLVKHGVARRRSPFGVQGTQSQLNLVAGIDALADIFLGFGRRSHHSKRACRIEPMRIGRAHFKIADIELEFVLSGKRAPPTLGFVAFANPSGSPGSWF